MALKQMARAIGTKTVLNRLGEPIEIIYWRSYWEGTDKVGPPGGSERERARRRRQILSRALRAANGFVGGHEAIAEAYAHEHPKVIILKPTLFDRVRKLVA